MGAMAVTPTEATGATNVGVVGDHQQSTEVSAVALWSLGQVVFGFSSSAKTCWATVMADIALGQPA
jgi:hypothetical protein